MLNFHIGLTSNFLHKEFYAFEAIKSNREAMIKSDEWEECIKIHLGVAIEISRAVECYN